MGLAEGLERCQLKHRFDLALEENGQHGNVHRVGVAQAGADLDVAGRGVLDEYAVLRHGALSHQAFAERELEERLGAFLVRVAAQQSQRQRAICGVVNIEQSVLHPDQRRQLRENLA